MSAWTPPSIVISNDPDDPESQRLQIATPSSLASDLAQDPSWQLQLADKHLALMRPDGVSLCLDFTAGKARHRVNEAGQGAQALGKALGISGFRKKHGFLPTVVDATGGLGQDAWAMSSLGCKVIVLERHPIVHALLANALERANEDEFSQDIANRITLLNTDAITWLSDKNHSDQGQAIYLDPMYPARKQKAGSKKGMQFLHALLGPPDTDESTQLLRSALAYHAHRVVVKRPKGAENLAGTELWTGQRTTIQSANTRYDIYHQSRKF
jgi:16S rRNA (guanine1516-N2)-methyltransferase